MNNPKKQKSISRYVKLEDYEAFDYEIPEIFLDFVIKKNAVNVTTRLKLVKKNKNVRNLVLDGTDILIKKIFIDDDQDCVIFEVRLTKPKKGGKEASCHVGYKSCFYRKIENKNGEIYLKFTEKKKSFDPNIVYKGIPNPTKI